MKTESVLFSRDELLALLALVGESWRCYGSEDLAPELDIATFTMFVETTGPSLTFQSELEILDLEKEPDEYTVLHITSGADSKAARSRGGMNFVYGGRKIQQIFIHRNHITEEVDGSTTFDYTSDDGVIFQLDDAAVAITKGGIWTCDFQISTEPTIEQLDVYDAVDEWDADLQYRYAGGQTLIPLADLLA